MNNHKKNRWVTDSYLFLMLSICSGSVCVTPDTTSALHWLKRFFVVHFCGWHTAYSLQLLQEETFPDISAEILCPLASCSIWFQKSISNVLPPKCIHIAIYAYCVHLLGVYIHVWFSGSSPADCENLTRLSEWRVSKNVWPRQLALSALQCPLVFTFRCTPTPGWIVSRT